MSVAEVKLLLSALTVAGQVYLLLFFTPLLNPARSWLRKNSLKLSFVVALLATMGSLFFSEIAHYDPCKLCWYQRILMYPNVILLGIAIWKKTSDVVKYTIPLAVFGALIATYHYALQVYAKLNPNFVDACSATSVSCAAAPSWTFGYITIPLMSLTAFLLIIVLCFDGFRKK